MSHKWIIEADWILERNLGMKQYARKPEFYKFYKGSKRISKPRQKWSSRAHRTAWENHFRVKIPAGYHIHHKDKNTENNDPRNLLALPPDEHIKIHELNGDRAAVTILKRFNG